MLSSLIRDTDTEETLKRTRTAKTTAAAEATAERWREALELRKAGHSYDVIAERCGYSDRGAAYKAVQTALREITAEAAEDVRKLEVERLDAQLVRLADVREHAALEGDLATVLRTEDVTLRVGERRARLLGVDAPTKTQEVPPEKLTDAELAEELKAALARLEQQR